MDRDVLQSHSSTDPIIEVDSRFFCNTSFPHASKIAQLQNLQATAAFYGFLACGIGLSFARLEMKRAISEFRGSYAQVWVAPTHPFFISRRAALTNAADYLNETNYF